MTIPKQRTGRAGEDFVAAQLMRNGWRIIERNSHSRFGEIDIVALDGEALVFVEVKASHQSAKHGPERPVLAVGPRKQRQLRRLATGWMTTRKASLRFRDIRFDVVGVSFDAAGMVVDCEHIRAAF